ncbi:POTRA domain-containing protein [Blattabacterium clevelandi]|uniref:POTRA domain-containing protein n=1 Tax=Blattabacterium clevelandi TaxID=164516 RepID=UPI0012602C95|nr:hypothetical protein [Blattabacterium clevelandi]
MIKKIGEKTYLINILFLVSFFVFFFVSCNIIKKVPKEKYIQKNKYIKSIYCNYFRFKNGEKSIKIESPYLKKKSVKNFNSKVFFEDNINFSILRKKKKTGKITYNNIHPSGRPYFINEIIYNFQEKDLKDIYINNIHSSLIKKREQYSEKKIIFEIERMKKMYENHGYYNFHVSDIKFHVNSIENQKINLYMEVKNFHNHKKYFFNKIVIRINNENKNFFIYNGYKFFVPTDKKLNPKIITDILTIFPGSLYKKNEVLKTQKNIYSLHHFDINQFKVEEEKKTNLNSKIAFLNAKIFLKTLRSNEFKFYLVNSISKKMDITINPKITLLSRNILQQNGANFMFSINGSLNYSPKEIFNLSKISLKGNLIYPGFTTNFISSMSPKYSLYRTHTSIFFQIKNKKNMDIKKYIFSNFINYEWKVTPYRKHKIKMITFKVIKKMINSKNFKKKNNDHFDSKNPIQKKQINRIKDNFINSIIYNYEMNQFFDHSKKYPIALRGNINISVNILYYLFQRFFFPNKLLNNIFLVKYNLDFKQSFSLSKNDFLISRLFIEKNFNYEKIPKNFFSGISEFCKNGRKLNSIHLNVDKNSSFNKILLVNEYRNQILSNLFSVIFLYLENRELLNKENNNSKKIEKLIWNPFYKEFLLEGGIGVRYDLKFFVFFVDFVYKLYDSSQKGWIINYIKLKKPLINFGIDPPF